MVVSDPVEPTMVAQSCPFSILDSPIKFSSAPVISPISGPVLKLTSIDWQYIDIELMFILPESQL
jgi:hypothetical protein